MADPTNNPVTSRYYPALSSVVNPEDIPDILGFIKDGILDLFSVIHYKDLQYNKSPRGDAAFYSLSIVSKKRLGIELPGTGISLVLNPDFSGEPNSSFPITVSYEWKILGYLRSFNLDSFSFDPQQYFEVALQILNISEQQALAHFINTFAEPVGSATALEQFVSDVNTTFGLTITAPTEETSLDEVAREIYTETGQYSSLVAFGAYVLTTDGEETLENLKTYFKQLLPVDLEEYIKDILLPKVRATLELSAGIEFPRNILSPVYDEFGINPLDPSDTGEPLTLIPGDSEGNPKVILGFGQALFYADTQKGMGYNLDLILNTNVPAQVANTGLIVDIQNLKIDISRDENIAEADADNRPPEFMGVYMERTDIFLPKKWFKKETGQTLVISGRQLLIGTGGMSGTIALRATPAVDEVGNVTDYFTEYFDFNFPITALVDNVETPIANYTALLAYVNTLSNPNDPIFKYPLEVTTPNAVITFEEEQEYFNFINLMDPDQFMWFQLGKNEDKAWRLGFNHFDLTFDYGQVTESNLKARLEIPKFTDPNLPEGSQTVIDLEGHWYSEDDFSLTAAFLPNGLELTLFDFITFNFLDAELGRDDGNFFIGTTCQIWFENETMQKIIGDQIIEIPRVRLYDNGTIEIVGGNGFIPTNISLNLGPIDVAVTGIHYGSTQKEFDGDMRKYNYWGFDGAISLDPLGIDARGEGIKYYYTTDNDELNEDGTPKYNGGDSFIRIQTIEVDLIIPGSASPETATAIIHGMLSLPEPGVSEEYAAEVSIKLPKARIAGGASMRLQPRHPAFIIEAGIEIPTPIPLAATGLGFYGFGGLLGYQYVADKAAIPELDEDATWYEYFTYPERGVNLDKFTGPEMFEELGYSNAFSVGAGTVIATQFDDGNLFSTRLMAILSLPSVFILDGRANVLGERLGMLDNTEPPFFAFVAIGDNSIEFGFGADYQLPKSNGWILDLYVEAQAGFFFDNPSAWYINFGTRDNPVTARLLTLFTAQSYLMLSAQGIEAGARLDFDLRKRFGPFKVHIYAYLEVGGFISFERPQIGGYIAAGGGIDIDVWIIGISLAFDAIFSAEAAKPFLLYAEVRFRACVKILFIKVCKSFTVKLKWEKNRTVDRNAIPPLPLNKEEELVTGIHMMTNEVFPINYLGSSSAPSNPSAINAIVPLDTYIEFKTEKGLRPAAVSGSGKIIGGYTFPPENHKDLIPPEKVVYGGLEIRQVKHDYSIEDIEIKAWNGSNWVDYHPYKAAVKASTPEDLEEIRNVVAPFKYGYWQLKGKQYDTVRLLATSPFTYMDAGEPGWVIPEQYGITASTLFCSEELRVEDCSNVLSKELGTKYYPPTQFVGHFIDGAYYTLANVSGYEIIDGNIIIVDNEYMEVTNAENVFGFAKSLSFNNYNRMVIILPEASVKAKFKLTTDAQGVTLRFFKSIINELTSVVEYELVEEQYKLAADFNVEVEYGNEDNPFTKIEIVPDDPNIQAILDLLEQIAGLFEITYDEVTGEVTISEPSNVLLYNQLLAQLELLKAEACSDKEDENGDGKGGENGGGDCDPHPVICPLYEQLLILFENCFVPVETSEQVDQNIDCFWEFEAILKILLTYIPEEDYLAEYLIFLELLSRIDQFQGHHEQILRFLNLKASAELLLDMILNYGGCNCDPKPDDKCDTSLQEICWLTLENHEWNETIPGSAAIEEEYELMVAALEKTIQPIWRPNTSYYIKYTLKDNVDNGSSNSQEFDRYYGFKTVGPLGHYHKHPDVTYIAEDRTESEYPLTSLRSYIDYNRSYPNADGNLLRAKPVFYGHDQLQISLYFNTPLAQNLMDKWHEYNGLDELDGELYIAIKDPVTNVVIPYPLPIGLDETVPDVINDDDGPNGWEGVDDPLLPPHIQTIVNMITNGEIPCDIVLGDQITPASTFFTTRYTNLKPQKLYTALFYNAFEVSTDNMVSEPVHEYVFQTSRYENFEEQVRSYLLDIADTVENQAVYDLPIAVDEAAIDKAFQILDHPENQIGDPLESTYQHLFDRVIEGVFEITPLDPPVRTEFHKIINTNTGNIIAILIRNPEPFNIPKIPLEIAQKTIEVTFANGSTHGSYQVLHSKDYSQAIVMRGSGNITAPAMHFKFTYLTWNGSEYEEQTIPVEDIIINE